MRNFITAIGLLASTSSVVDHSIFQDIWVNEYGLTFHFSCQLAPLANNDSRSLSNSTTCTRMLPNNSPVTTVSSEDLRCNLRGSKGVVGACPAQGMA
jgi:cellulase